MLRSSSSKPKQTSSHPFRASLRNREREKTELTSGEKDPPSQNSKKTEETPRENAKSLESNKVGYVHFLREGRRLKERREKVGKTPTACRQQNLIPLEAKRD